MLIDAKNLLPPGTDEYCPPEFEEMGEYNGKPATVWSLGILLFALVCGDFPNTHDLHKINENNYSKAGLSDGKLFI